MTTKDKLTLMFLTIAVLAVLVNAFLIFLALRVPKKNRDIRLVLFLALVDMITPTAAIIISVYNLYTNQHLSVLSSACQLHGPISYITMHLSMMFVSIIAFTRTSRVYDVTVSKVVWVVLTSYTIIYCGIAITNGIESRFNLLPNGLDCAPLDSSDPLSVSLTIAFGTSLITFLTITLTCYITLVVRMFIEDRETVIPLQHGSIDLSHARTGTLSRSRRTKVAIRISIVCLTYFILIAPACILLIAEASLPVEDSHLITTIIDFCINSIAIANPCLVLFTHSNIHHQLCRFIAFLLSLFSYRSLHPTPNVTSRLPSPNLYHP